VKPVDDAAWHIANNVDKDGLQKRFVNEDIGIILT